MQNAPGCLGHVEFFAEDMVEIQLDQAVDGRALALVERTRAATREGRLPAATVKEHEPRLHDDAPVCRIGQSVVDDGELQIVGLAAGPHDLHLEEHEHLAHDLRDDLLAVAQREGPDAQSSLLRHCWASWHSLQRPKNLTWWSLTVKPSFFLMSSSSGSRKSSWNSMTLPQFVQIK